MEGIWSIATVVGPILLIGAIIWAFLRNRGDSRANVARAERGAREVREEIKREEERNGA